MIKTAILIDGAYFLKRLLGIVPDADLSAPEGVADLLEQLVRGHLERLNETWGVPDCYQLLYRGFYYDARPSGQRIRRPVSRGLYQHSATAEAQFRVRLFKALHGRRYFAVRLGEVGITPAWLLRREARDRLLDGDASALPLSDADFVPSLRQKGVDMRIGLDIASITLKRQADTIVLVSGDTDFVPAAKLARREGARFFLDPLGRTVSPTLFEHIDGLLDGLPRIRQAHRASGA